jgi:uncharacterized membrane protein YkvI
MFNIVSTVVAKLDEKVEQTQHLTHNTTHCQLFEIWLPKHLDLVTVSVLVGTAVNQICRTMSPVR